MMLVLEFFALAFSALLPVINPLGSALVFLGLVEDAPDEVLRRLSRKIAISTALFLTTIELLGAALLAFFGISLPVVQVAGGFVLAAMGWRLLNDEAPAAPEVQDAQAAVSAASLDGKVFFPFTFPVTAGPGTIVVMLTLSAHASRNTGSRYVFAHLGIVVAVVALCLSVMLSYRYAPKITKKIAPQTVHGILRVIAFVLLCIGVQIAWNGLAALFRTLH
ncbi:MAG: MarC family protein [Gemmatimonadaceae bacterium]